MKFKQLEARLSDSNDLCYVFSHIIGLIVGGLLGLSAALFIFVGGLLFQFITWLMGDPLTLTPEVYLIAALYGIVGWFIFSWGIYRAMTEPTDPDD